MTAHAHGSRRYHGSTEETTAATCLERNRFNLRALHPWLYSNIPSSRTSKQKKIVRKNAPRDATIPERIFAWLKATGSATAAQVAAGLRIETQTARAVLVRRPDMFRVVTEKKETGRQPVRVWGVVDDGETV